MIDAGRRSFLCLSSLAAAGSSLAILAGSSGTAGAQGTLDAQNRSLIAAQVQREKTLAFFRSFYLSKDLCDIAGFLSHFTQSTASVYQDATLGFSSQGYNKIAAAFSSSFGTLFSRVGAGRFSKILHAQGHSVLITGFQERAADRS